jgi:hypothetical protein
MGTLEAENKAFEDLKHKHIAMGSALLERRPFFHYPYTHTYAIFSTSLRSFFRYSYANPFVSRPFALGASETNWRSSLDIASCSWEHFERIISNESSMIEDVEWFEGQIFELGGFSEVI